MRNVQSQIDLNNALKIIMEAILSSEGIVNIISQTIMTFLCTFQLKTDSAGRVIFIKQKEPKLIPFNKNLFQSNSLRSRILQIGVSLSHLSLEVLNNYQLILRQKLDLLKKVFK